MQQSTIVEQHCFDYACSGVPERKVPGVPPVVKLTVLSVAAKLLYDRWVLIGHALLLNNVIGVGQFRLKDIESRKNGR
jgi:hypothetical protein